MFDIVIALAAALLDSSNQSSSNSSLPSQQMGNFPAAQLNPPSIQSTPLQFNQSTQTVQANQTSIQNALTSQPSNVPNPYGLAPQVQANSQVVTNNVQTQPGVITKVPTGVINLLRSGRV